MPLVVVKSGQFLFANLFAIVLQKLILKCLIFKKNLLMQISFFIRQGTGKFCGIYVHITIDKVRTKTAFSSGIKILESEWNSKTKTIKNFERNLELQALKDRIQHIYNVHYMEGKYITAEEVRILHLQNIKTRLPEKQILVTDLLDVFDKHLDKQFLQDKITKNTYKHYQGGITAWRNFLLSYPNLKAEEFGKIHLEKFCEQKWAGNTLNSRLVLIKGVFSHAVDEKLIQHIGFASLPKKRVSKDNKPLEKADLERILAVPNGILTFPDYKPNRGNKSGVQLANIQKAFDLFKIQIFTGLAFCDTQNFDPKKHLEQIDGKPFLVIKRQKTSRKTDNESVVPFFEETFAIAKKYGGAFPKMRYLTYRQALKNLCKLFETEGFVPNETFRSHKGRKTATYYLTTIKGYDRDLVRIMLGHATDQMSEKHYFDARKYMEGKL